MVIGFLAGIITDRLSSLNCKKRTYNFKNVMTEKTFVKITAKRFKWSDGCFQNVVIRVFSLVMAVITVVCTVNCIIAYREYLRVTDKPDIVGYAEKETPRSYTVYYDYTASLVKKVMCILQSRRREKYLIHGSILHIRIIPYQNIILMMLNLATAACTRI